MLKITVPIQFDFNLSLTVAQKEKENRKVKTSKTISGPHDANDRTKNWRWALDDKGHSYSPLTDTGADSGQVVDLNRYKIDM